MSLFSYKETYSTKQKTSDREYTSGSSVKRQPPLALKKSFISCLRAPPLFERLIVEARALDYHTDGSATELDMYMTIQGSGEQTVGHRHRG